MNLAKGTSAVADVVLQELEQRAIVSSEDRAAWLEARRNAITATEVGKLRKGGAGARRTVVAEKFEPPADLAGNRYIDRGVARESWIADWAAARFRGLRPNTTLYRARENERHAATPDLVGVDRDGRLVIGEIKTSKHDLDPHRIGSHFPSTTYLEQMQWQMHVTGAERCLFVWEQHDDNWPDPQPLELEPGAVWINRDDAEIERLVALADRALAEIELERARRNGEELTPGGQELNRDVDGLARAVLDARIEQKTAEARVKAPWSQLLAALESTPSFSQTGLARVTWTNEIETEDVLDADAAIAADPELYAEFRSAMERWHEHEKRFRTTRERSVRKLTVTEPKAANR